MTRSRLLAAAATGLAMGPLIGAQVPDPARRLPEPAGSERRLALVVGNDRYGEFPPLRNAANDARAVGQALKGLGFEVRAQENAGRVAFERAVDEFVESVREGDVALFYYAGHGMEIEGQNYLLPVDFRATNRVDAKYESYAAQRVVEKLRDRGARLRIVVLDACRNNPFTGRSISAGLSPMHAVEGEFIAFATAPKQVASDNASEANGLFTKHLVEALAVPGQTLQQAFKRVQRAVHEASRGAQLPFAEDGVVGDFYLTGAPAPGTSSGGAAALAAIAQLQSQWQSQLREQGEALKRVRRGAAEATAMGDARSFASAQVAYSSNNGGAFGRPACLIAPDRCGFVAGTTPFIDADILNARAGYQRRFEPGEPLDGSVDKNGLDGFVFILTPIPGQGGQRGFAVDGSGLICFTEDGTPPPNRGGRLADDCKPVR